MEPVKICFVVLAHHQPAVFQRLLRHVAWENSDVVIHIDRDVDIREFPDPGASNIHFMPRRRKVCWSGWSLTRCLVEGLEYGLRVSDAGYFMYLAGTDFPLRRGAEITAFLRQHWPANFLNHYPLVPGIWGYGLVDRFRFNDLRSRFVSPKAPNDRGVAAWRRLAARLLGSFEQALNARLRPRDTSFMKLYSGSSRWCLNRETAQYVVDYYHSAASRDLRGFLKSCANSDEIFIQTAILNSKFKEQCLGFDENAAAEIFAGERSPMPDEKRVYLHYIDWSPEREDPAILTQADLQALRESGKYFACKFTDDRSLPLIDAIEQELLDAEPQMGKRAAGQMWVETATSKS